MKKIIVFYILVIISLLGCSTNSITHQKSSRHYYSVISMQINNLEKFNEYQQKVKPILQSVGGKIIRDFDVVGKPNGSIAYGKVNRVLFVEFNSATGLKQLSSNVEYKKYRLLLKNSTSNLKILSGGTQKPYSSMKGELFILKISNYKKQDGQAQQIAYRINQKLKNLYDFHVDILFKINRAQGLVRADDVGIFLYKNASDQKRLYSNKDVLKSIGDFNKKYLDNFVYLTLRPVK